MCSYRNMLLSGFTSLRILNETLLEVDCELRTGLILCLSSSHCQIYSGVCGWTVVASKTSSVDGRSLLLIMLRSIGA